MSALVKYLDNPFALAGFAALLLVGLTLQLVESKRQLDKVRARLVESTSFGLIIIGVGGLVLGLFIDKPEAPAQPEVTVETQGEVRDSSPSFGDVKGNVEIHYGDQGRTD